MSIFDDVLEVEGATTSSPVQQVGQASLFSDFSGSEPQQDTFMFPYRGQNYEISMAGFNSKEEAIDAFLSQQNEPVSITPTEEDVPTDVQLQPEEQAGGFEAPAPIDPDLDDEPFDPTFSESFGEVGRRFYGAATDIAGEALRGSAIGDIGRAREAGTKGLGDLLTGGIGGRDKAVAMQAFAFMNRANASEEEKRLLEQAKADRPGVKELIEHPAFKLGSAIKDFSAETFVSDERFDGTALAHLSEGAGSLATFALSAIGTPAMTALVGGNVNSATQFMDAINEGADFDTALKSAEVGKLVGLTEALPISAVMNRMNKATGGVFGKGVTEAIKKKVALLRKSKTGDALTQGIGGAIEEALQEAFVEFMNNKSAKDIIGYDKDRDVFQGVGTSAEVGGALGFVLSTLAGARGRIKRDHLQKTSDDLLKLLEDRGLETSIEDQPIAADTLPDVTDTLPSVVEQITDPAEAVLPDPVNDPDASRLAGIRADIVKELGLEGVQRLEDADVDRLANLRADTRVEEQLTLDLGQEPGPVQETLDLQRDFEAAGQAPDSGIQQELALGGDPLALDPTNVVGIMGTAVQLTPVDIVLGDTGVVDVEATTATLPPVQAGRVRLYRAESPTTKFDDVFKREGLGDFPVSKKQLELLEAGTAKHFTDDLSYADYYRETYGEDAVMSYIDVPRSIADRSKASPGEFIIETSITQGGTQKQLYRGLKKDGKPRGYPGAFFTEDEILAQSYARTSQADGTVITRDGTPAKPFDVDAVAAMPAKERKTLLAEYTAFSKERGIKVEAGYLWDVLAKGETDFVYPTKTDVEFLKTKGYDSARFENEGGQRVASWFIFEGEHKGIVIEGNFPTPVDKLTKVEEEQIRVEQQRRGVDQAEQAGMDLTDIAEQDKADRALDESRGSPQPTPVTEDLVAEQVIRAVPDPDGQPQLPGLRAQALETPAPQQELGLEGGSEGITPTTTGGTAPPPPPIPRTASRETKNATQALAAVGRSRSIAGEPIKVDIAEDHSAISVDGRTFKNRSRDAMNRFRKIPNWARVYIDLASTIRITGPRVAEEIYRSLQSDTRALGQAVTNHNKRFEAAFRISTGKKFSKATREESRLMHRYMNGEVELSTLRDELGANKDLIKVLDDMRADIKSLGMAFLDEGIIASEMRATVQENLGTYLHATYAANVLNTPGTNLDTLLSKIPQEHQDQWVAAFLQVHRSPIEDGTLGTLDISTLRRMIKTLGLTGRRSTIDSKTGESVDEVYLIDHPQQKSINSASKEDMMEILSRHHVPEDVKSDTIINTLKTGAGATSLPTLSGVDSSIQRKRSLARNEKDLREAGYTEAEIKLNQATRELLMEVVNPITSTGITMRKMMDYITAHRFINNIALLKDSGLVAIGKAEGDLNTQLIPADHPMGRIRIPDPSREGGYTQAGPTSEVSKDGLYVHPEVASMVQHLLGISSVPSMPSFVRFVAVLGKINLTAGASRTHVRNTVTAGQLALSHGHLMDAPSKTVPGMKIAKGAALRDLGRGKLSNKTGKRELQDDLDDILEYTTSLDIWNNSLGVGAVKEIMVRELSKKDASDAFGTNTYVGLDGSTAEQLLSKYTGKALAKPLQLYRLEDEAVKVYAFIVERQRYAKLTGREDILEVIEGRVPNPTDEQLEAVRIFDRGVANYITSVYPTYSRVFRWGRALSRNLIVTDFPSFNLEMFRNSTNDYIDMIQLATGEGRYEGVDKAKRIPVLGQRIAAKLLFHGTNLKSLAAVSIPLLMASGDYSEEDDPVFNPIGVGATLKDRQRAQRASQRASNGQPFSKQALEPVIAEMGGTWYKYAQIKIHDFVPGEYVDVEVLDFSIAGGQQTVMAVNAAAAIEMLVAHGDIEGASEAVLAGLEAAMYDYIKFSVAVKTSEEIISGTRESGGHIWEEDDSPSEKLKKSALHIYKVMIPTGSLVREGMRLKDASDEGRLSDEALNHAIGRSKKRNRIDGWLVSNLKRLENDSQGFAAAEKRINRLVSSSDNMTDAEFINKYTDLAERRRNGYDSIRNVINNARALGMSDVRIEDKLKAEKLASKGGMKPVDFMDDYYSPYQRTFKEAFTRFKPRKRSKLSPLEIEIAGESMIATIEHRLDLIQSVQDAAGE